MGFYFLEIILVGEAFELPTESAIIDEEYEQVAQGYEIIPTARYRQIHLVDAREEVVARETLGLRNTGVLSPLFSVGGRAAEVDEGQLLVLD